MNILVVEDNVELNASIVNLCRTQRANKVDASFDGEEGLYLAENNEYDVVILDLMLPKVSGLDVLKGIRRKKKTCGVLVLTAISEKETVLEALRIGADDYVIKPFDADILLARIEAIGRKNTKEYDGNSYEFKTISLNYDTMMLKIDGEINILTGKLYDIFEYLVRNRNTIVTKDKLFNRVWGFDSDTIYTVTEVYISKLRKILDKYGYKANLVTIKNIGYMWDESKS